MPSDRFAIAEEIIATRHKPLWEQMLQKMATAEIDADPTTDEGGRAAIEQARAWHGEMARLHSQMARALDEAHAAIAD